MPMLPSKPVARRRIVMVTQGHDPIGTGRQVELVAEGLLAAGWDVHLAVTSRGGALPGRLAQAGIDVHRISSRPAIDTAAHAAALGRLAVLTRSLRPAVVLAWGRSQARLAAGAGLLAPGGRLVSHVAARPRGLMTGLALRRSACVIATSDAVAADCRRVGVSATRIATIPPAACPADAVGLSRAALAARLGLDAAKLWTLCVAPLVAESRLERLLWAIDQLGVVHRRLEHVLVGTGPLRGRVLRRARVQQIAERLHLFPHLDCLPDLLRETRLVWQSGEVACGGAILDAMPLGTPTVAVSSTVARQLIVEGETGRIVPPEPESEFPRRAFGLLEDDALAARYGAAARLRSAAFPVDRMVAAVMATMAE